MGTMDTNPEILMSTVVSHLKQRQGCVFIIAHILPLLTTRVAVKGYPILPSPFRLLPPPLLLLCMHISHSHEINHTVGPGQCTCTHTHKHKHTHPLLLPHQWSIDARRRRRGRCIHSLSIVPGSSVSPVNRRGSA